MSHARYGAQHRTLAEQVCATAVGSLCWRCGLEILPGQAVDAGHVVDKAIDPNSTALVPEHRSCNRRAGARLGKRKSKLNPSRSW